MLTSQSLLPLNGFHLSRWQFISHLNLLSLLAGNLYSFVFLSSVAETVRWSTTVNNQVGYYWYITQIFSINVIKHLSYNA